MVVKSERGRRRYVAFTVNESLTKETLISKLRSFVPPEEAPYVIQCASGWAIIRCAPKEHEDTVALMKRADPSSESVMTSGTLRTLRARYPILESTRPPARYRS